MTRYPPLALLAALLLSPAAQADMIDTEGMAPWEVCGLCHGYTGLSAVAKFPRLAGQKAAYIEKQLADFSAGHRENDGGQMVAIVTEIGEGDHAAIAEWFASQDPPTPETPDGDAALGEAVWQAQGCAECHHSDSAPGTLIAPHLSAQHERYLRKQLSDFRDGARSNDPEAVMRTAASALSDAEIDALAAFLSGSERQ